MGLFKSRPAQTNISKQGEFITRIQVSLSLSVFQGRNFPPGAGMTLSISRPASHASASCVCLYAPCATHSPVGSSQTLKCEFRKPGCSQVPRGPHIISSNTWKTVYFINNYLIGIYYLFPFLFIYLSGTQKYSDFLALIAQGEVKLKF